MSADVDTVLDHVTALVEEARALPMSASCVLNRHDVLELLDDARRLLPAELASARRLLSERESLVEQGRAQAARLVEQGQQEQARLVEATAVFTRAKAEADRLLEDARAQAEAMRLQTEDYVDAKLANFEVVLSKTLATVQRGRGRLGGRTDLDDLRSEDLDDVEA